MGSYWAGGVAPVLHQSRPSITLPTGLLPEDSCGFVPTAT